MSTKERQSNFELLRIVAMLFIVCHHLVIKGADTCGYVTPYTYEKDGLIGIFINSFVVGGVNLFVLISGYFGIRKLIQPLLKLGIDLVVYGLIAYILGVLFLHIDFSISGMAHGIDLHNWFVIHFALLILMSPILESALQGQTSKTLQKWIFLLLIINVVFGYILGYVNINGYNYLNFILLYVMARYIRVLKEGHHKFSETISKYSLFGYFLSAFLLVAGVMILYYSGHFHHSDKYFGYNNPLILLSAFALFCYFSSLKIQSKTINTIATGMFGVFLMHTPPEIIPIRNQYSSVIFKSYGYAGLMLEAVCLFVILTFISIFIEQFNKKIVNHIYVIIKK